MDNKCVSLGNISNDLLNNEVIAGYTYPIQTQAFIHQNVNVGVIRLSRTSNAQEIECFPITGMSLGTFSSEAALNVTINVPGDLFGSV